MDTVKVEVITTGEEEEEESLERAAVEVILRQEVILQHLEVTEGAGHLLIREPDKG